MFGAQPVRCTAQLCKSPEIKLRYRDLTACLDLQANGAAAAGFPLPNEMFARSPAPSGAHTNSKNCFEASGNSTETAGQKFFPKVATQTKCQNTSRSDSADGNAIN